MKNIDQIRAEQKLALWQTPGFFQFIDDLQDMFSKDTDKNLTVNVELLRRRYLKLREDDPGKFKQTKLDI